MSTNTQRKFRRFLSDAYAFVRSREANSAIASVTLDQLIVEHLWRNGEEEGPNSAQFNPYAFDPTETQPAGTQPFTRANFLGGSNHNLPTRLDRVRALVNAVDDMTKAIKELPLSATAELDPNDNRRRLDETAVDSTVFGTEDQ